MPKLDDFSPHQPRADEVRPYDLVELQERIKRVLNALTGQEQLGSKLLASSAVAADGLIALTAGVENLIEHGLAQAVKGWSVVDVDTPALVWRVTATTSDATKYLSLGTSADCNVRLVVF